VCLFISLALLLCVSSCSLCLCVETSPLQLTPQELAGRLEQAGDNPIELLALVRFVDDIKARELRLDVQKKLTALAKKLTPAEQYQLAQQLAKVLPSAVTSPDEAIQILGTKKTVSRQLLHRRYLKQWRYEVPLPLLLTFEHPKGRPPQLIVARPD
jgi:hypothetical protein